MLKENNQVFGWGKIILLLVVIAFGAGLILGLLDHFIGLAPGIKAGGVGASVGVAAALLIAQRRAAMRA